MTLLFLAVVWIAFMVFIAITREDDFRHYMFVGGIGIVVLEVVLTAWKYFR